MARLWIVCVGAALAACSSSETGGGPLPSPDAGSGGSTTAPGCGNDRIDPGEVCDGNDLGGLECATVAAGYRSGTLGCQADCTGYDFAECVPGGTVSASSCSQPDVQAAIDAAADGDRVQVPPGSCTWSTKVELCKSVVLEGAGIGATIITDDTAPSGSEWTEVPIWIEGCTNKALRVTGFSFRDTGTEEPSGMIMVWADGIRFRFDHLEFVDTVARALWLQGTGSYGVIDHIRIEKTTPIHAQDIIVNDADADGSWSRPMSYGTADAVFIEDSVFDHVAPPDMTVDCTNGGRYVFRRNEVRNSKIANHGLDSVGRSCLQMEIYDNTLRADYAEGVYMAAVGSRGGSAVVYGNTIIGNFGLAIGITNYRSCCYAGAACTPGGEPSYGTCDGQNPLDGNQQPVATLKGWPCKDQIGRGTNQASEPFYEWSNTFDGEDADVTVFNTWDGCDDPQPRDHVQPGRDYFDDTPRPGYVPYVYPHPLTLVP